LFNTMTTASSEGRLDEILANSVNWGSEKTDSEQVGRRTKRGSLIFEAPPPVRTEATLPPAMDVIVAESDSDDGRSPAEASLREMEEKLRIRARDTLVKASQSDALEKALAEVQEERKAEKDAAARTPLAKEANVLPTPSAPVKLSGKEFNAADKPAVAWALDAVSERDRRVGELLAMISETQRSILERDEQCQQIEEKLGAARLDLAHLELDVEWHRRTLDSAKERSNELEANQKKLLVDLDGQTQKLRHANIEARESCLMSAQSEISTATGGATASSIGCFTPRLHNTMQDPLSSPGSTRWVTN